MRAVGAAAEFWVGLSGYEIATRRCFYILYQLAVGRGTANLQSTLLYLLTKCLVYLIAVAVTLYYASTAV